jgi:hypothetical protein
MHPSNPLRVLAAGVWGFAPNSAWRDTLKFCFVKLLKTKTASRFWFAQGIEAVSFFAAGKKDTSG